MDVIRYQGYHAKIEYSYEDGALIGRVLDVSDLLLFEANAADEVEAKFHALIDDYLAVCEELGKAPERPFSGSFNVRISSELHRRAALSAARRNLSLNQFVASAIEDKLDKTELLSKQYVTEAASVHDWLGAVFQRKKEVRGIVYASN